MREPNVLLCARDAAVVEAVEVSAATCQVPLQLVADNESIKQGWRAAALRLVSTEVAARWHSAPPGQAYLVGRDIEELARCSAELGLPVLPLPDRNGRLAAALTGALHTAQRKGTTICLLGASGGLGVTTLAAAMALEAARRGAKSAAVDLAVGSGGIDLVLGLETAKGLRWPDLLHARGEADEVLAELPGLDGAAFLAQGRDHPQVPSQEAVAAVLGALTRSAAVVVVDGGRAVVSGCEQVVLVVGADVHSVAAARSVVGEQQPDGLVVRCGPGRSLPAAAIARSLGAPVLGVIGQIKALPRLAELGLSPVAPPARKYRKQVAAVLGRLSDG